MNDRGLTTERNVSNPEQIHGRSRVMVELSWIAQQRRSHAKVQPNGIVSSFFPPASGFRLVIPRNIAEETQAATLGSSTAEGVPVLRVDHATSQAHLSGVWEVAQPRYGLIGKKHDKDER